MSLLSPLADRTFARLFGAQVSALVGTGLLTIALALFAYELAGEEGGAVLGTALAIKMTWCAAASRSAFRSLTRSGRSTC